MHYTVKKYKNYQNDDALLGQLSDIINESFSKVKFDTTGANILYTAEEVNGNVLAFFMVGYEDVEDLHCCYLGLSGCRKEWRNNDITKSLYKTFISDCKQIEKDRGIKIICFTTTISPVIFKAFDQLFLNVSPANDGSCTPEAAAIIKKIATANYKKAVIQDDKPFLLRFAVPSVQYSESEIATLSQTAHDTGMNTFINFKLNNINGDRLLMIGYV